VYEVAQILAERDIEVRVLHLPTIKPLDLLTSVFGVPSGLRCRSTPQHERAVCRIRPEGAGHG
jgi:hypothetical protein